MHAIAAQVATTGISSTWTTSSAAPPPRRPAAPSLDHDLPPGDRYQFRGEHGRGGGGRVSRAYDRVLGRDVAIKEPLRRGSGRDVRFVREALITARLDHPGIIPVHEAGRWSDGTPFYVMKLVAGRSLRDALGEHATLAARLALLPRIIAVAETIAYAHGVGVIHRDLKPANLLLGDHGETVVIDWGLAKDLSSPDDSDLVDSLSPSSVDLTHDGSVIGTPAFMAPEQARGEPVDTRADVFALGAILWQLCALPGRPDADVIMRLRHAGIHPALAALIARAVAPVPADRQASAVELAAALHALPLAAHRPVAPRWSRGHTLVVSLAVAAATIGGALAIVP